MKYEIVAQNFDHIIQKYRNILLRVYDVRE